MRTLWLVLLASAHALLQIYWAATYSTAMWWGVFAAVMMWIGNGFHWLGGYHRDRGDMYRDMARALYQRIMEEQQARLAELGRYPAGWRR